MLYHGCIPYKKGSSGVAASVCAYFPKPGITERPENIAVWKQGGICSIRPCKPFKTGKVMVIGIIPVHNDGAVPRSVVLLPGQSRLIKLTGWIRRIPLIRRLCGFFTAGCCKE